MSDPRWLGLESLPGPRCLGLASMLGPCHMDMDDFQVYEHWQSKHL
jgi:hypothetical protein